MAPHPPPNPGRFLEKCFHPPTLITTSIPQPHLVQRQTAPATVTVVSNNGDNNHDSGLSGGAIAGIVVGSVVGFILLLWVIRSCFNLGAPPRSRVREKWYRYPPRRHRHHHHHHHHKRRRSSSVSVPPRVAIRGGGRRREPPPYIYTEEDRAEYYGRQ